MRVLMNQSPFMMMLSSGVIRPGDLEIRRAVEFGSLRMTRRLPEFLNSFLDVPMETESRFNHERNRHDLRRRQADDSPTFSWKTVAGWLGLQNRSEPPPTRPKSIRPQKTHGILEEKVRVLTSALKSEQARCQAQQEEIQLLRNEVKRMEQLQAELTVERVSGKLLVEWLQELEQRLYDIREGSVSRGGPADSQQSRQTVRAN